MTVIYLQINCLQISKHAIAEHAATTVCYCNGNRSACQALLYIPIKFKVWCAELLVWMFWEYSLFLLHSWTRISFWDVSAWCIHPTGTCGSCDSSRQTKPCPNGREMLRSLSNNDQKNGCPDHHPPLASSIGCPSFIPRNVVIPPWSCTCQLGHGKGKVEGSCTVKCGDRSIQ